MTMRRIVLAAALLSLFVLPGCNTLAGLGADLHGAARGMQGTNTEEPPEAWTR